MTTRDAKNLWWLLNVKNKREASGPKADVSYILGCLRLSGF